MSVNRREFFKMAGAGVGGILVPKASAQAAAEPVAGEQSAMLYDATVCVGCKACQVACKKRSNLPPELDSQKIHEMPTDLSANTWTLIKLYRSEDATETSFVKKQCMHCVEPACVSVCPVGALQKMPSGPVVYDDEKCIGCRYCMAACPYGVPKYQWSKAFPLIQKCDFCADRQAKGEQPACSEACPTGALQFSNRKALLNLAETRIQKSPDRYVNYVYGKDEAGGTNWLYLSKVAFEKLGFPTLKAKGLPELTWPYLEAVPGIIVVVGSLMSGLYWFFRRREKGLEASASTGKESGHGDNH